MGNFSNCNCANKEIDSIDKYSLITVCITILYNILYNIER